VGCFAVLKRLYFCLVEDQIRVGINHIGKFDFITAYPIARLEALIFQNIQTSFAATGLVLYNPERVLSKLDIQLRTPTPPGSRSSEDSLKTPQNVIQLQRQASSIKILLKERSKSPPSPLKLAINRVLKTCEMTINSAAILENKTHKLRAAHEKQKQIRTRSYRRIPIEEGLTVGELLEVIQPQVEAEEAPIPSPAAQAEAPILPAQPTRRKLPTCKKCGNKGHRSNHCPNK